MKPATYPLTYFTNSNIEELNDVIADLHTVLPKNDIVNLFVEKFNPNTILTNYGVGITSKLETAIRKTLEYDIDTEMFIRYIFNIIE